MIPLSTAQAKIAPERPASVDAMAGGVLSTAGAASHAAPERDPLVSRSARPFQSSLEVARETYPLGKVGLSQLAKLLAQLRNLVESCDGVVGRRVRMIGRQGRRNGAGPQG